MPVVRRTVVALFVVIAAVLPGHAGAGAAEPPTDVGRPDRVRVIVELTDRGRADAVVAGLGGQARELRRTKRLPFLVLEVARPALAGLARAPHVIKVQEDIAVPPALASTLPVINADDVHGLGLRGASATVAVLDTGIDDDHPAFAGRLVAERCFSTDNGSTQRTLCPDGTDEDVNADVVGVANCLDGTANICDHGTHVAGIAAGSGAPAGAPGDGVAPAADIVAVQVFTRFTQATDCNPNPAPCVRTFAGDQIAGLDAVLDLAADNPAWNLVAANMSLGGGENAAACDGDTRKTAIDSLLGAGIATVISAGNNSFDAAVGAPGCISTAVTVGSTTDADAVSGFSNRGTLVDVMAPGSSVTAAVPDDAYGIKSGTSMAAPHVAGALAVLRDANPARPIGDLVRDLVDTGVDITYASAGGTVTTPRIDLLAAVQVPNTPPVVTGPSSVTAPEGSVATATGTVTDSDGSVTAITASSGTVTRSGTSWAWTEQTADGPAARSVTITATDDRGATGSATFRLTTSNVAPVVTIAASQALTVAEGQPLAIAANFTDPGWPDTYQVTVDPGATHGQSGPIRTTIADGGPGVPDRGNVSSSYTYGDNGAYPVTVTVTDDDGGSHSASFTVTVQNTAPDARIDLGTATSWNGSAVVFGTAGTPTSFAADVTDPGSDDLTVRWEYGDGAADSRTHLVNPPNADPATSPTVQPRAVRDTVVHSYARACLYEAALRVTDDDAGVDTDRASVVILGTATQARTIGYWRTEYGQLRRADHTPDERACLLAITRHLSRVFAEQRDLSTAQQAAAVLNLRQNSGPRDTLDAQLLGAWLNVASGAARLNDQVDTDGNGTVDATVAAVLTGAETARLDAAAPRATLLAYKDQLERINTTL